MHWGLRTTGAITDAHGGSPCIIGWSAASVIALGIVAPSRLSSLSFFPC